MRSMQIKRNSCLLPSPHLIYKFPHVAFIDIFTLTILKHSIRREAPGAWHHGRLGHHVHVGHSVYGLCAVSCFILLLRLRPRGLCERGWMWWIEQYLAFKCQKPSRNKIIHTEVGLLEVLSCLKLDFSTCIFPIQTCLILLMAGIHVKLPSPCVPLLRVCLGEGCRTLYVVYT